MQGLPEFGANQADPVLAGLRGQASDLDLQGSEGTGPGAFGHQVQFPADRLVGGEHRAGAQGYGADLGAPRMPAGADLAADAGLAAAFTRQLGFRFWHGSSWDWGG